MSGQPERTLLPQHQALLDQSAISAEVVAARGYFSVSEPKELVGMFGASQRLAPALVIPVLNAYGERAFYQLRPDDPRVKNGRTQKYETPAGAGMAIDVPPATRPHLRNVKGALWITEGIRKADSLASIDLRAVALLGVWNWRGKGEDHGTTVLPDWESIALNDHRKVIICFDSDAFQSPGIHAATERLGRWLERRGAEVSFAYLPPAEDGSKLGVDDYLAAGASKEDLLGRVVREWRPLPSDISSPHQPAPEPVAPRALAEVLATFRRWLHLPDLGALLAMLGALAANMLPGDPVWLFLVSPPSSGKSELLQATTRVPIVHRAATLTEGALLSGTSARDRAAGAKGGLLNAIGPFGVLMLKDFGSVLSMQRDARASVLAALREIYDGSWTRHVGTDGGRTLHWEGKLGLLAGCTPTIDRHHAVMGAMGERFLLYRLPTADAGEQAAAALDHDGHEADMRRELGDAVAGLFANELTAPAPPSNAERAGLIALSAFVARSRSAVERDGYSREVELVSDPESPARLVLTFSRLLAGLTAIGVERPEAWRVVTKVALDSMPALRLIAIRVLYAAPADTQIETGKVADDVRYPTSTTRRVLEDLAAHGVAVRGRHGQGRSDTWQLSDWARARYRGIQANQTVPETSADMQNTVNGAVPEMSGEAHTPPSTPSPPTTFDVPLPASAQADISGTVPPGTPDDPAPGCVADAANTARPICAYAERHVASHRPHPETGLVVCQVCYPAPPAKGTT